MVKQLFIASLSSLIFLSGSIYAQDQEALIVHFHFDSFKLSATAQGEIDSFFRAGDRAGDTTLIAGYTDSIGSVAYNENLSVRRALAVKDYLVAKGLLAEGRIKTAGHGKEYPLTGNGSDSGRAANRRVEIFFQRRHADTVANMPPVRRDGVGAAPDTVAVQKETVVAPVQRENAVAPEQREKAVVAAPPKRTIYDVVTDSTVAVGSTIPLRDVNFFPARHIPLPVGNLILDELAQAMKANPKLRIRIEGHICCLPEGVDGADLGTGQPNLSVQRAKYVYDYLARLGIAKKRMSYVGFGASGKLYPREENEEERAENRRVEIRILAK